MTPKEALKVLIQGIDMGQLKGIFSLKDAVILANAVEVLTKLTDNKVKDINDTK